MAWSLFDRQGSGAIAGAVDWLQGTLLGSVATAIAVLAVALVGYGMMRGHFSSRRMLRVVLGCFLLFNSGMIARGLLQVRSEQPNLAGSRPSAVTTPIAQPPVRPAQTSGNPFDPYSAYRSPS